MSEVSDYYIYSKPIGLGKEISKENILEFLNSFKKRTGMYVDKPDNYDVVTSFLCGFLYCCFLHGFHYCPDIIEINNSAQGRIPDFIDNIIQEIESTT